MIDISSYGLKNASLVQFALRMLLIFLILASEFLLESSTTALRLSKKLSVGPCPLASSLVNPSFLSANFWLYSFRNLFSSSSSLTVFSNLLISPSLSLSESSILLNCSLSVSLFLLIASYFSWSINYSSVLTTSSACSV